jgi:G3E family GTPase
MAGAAVLINEFGEVGIDHHLVDRVDETMLILDSGCICCSVQGDLVKALRNLAQRSSKREIPEVTRVVIETTGLADPVPVIYTLTQERFVASRYRCDGVITAVDATHALRQLDHHREAVRQVTMADRLLITKCDLADTACRTLLDRRLDALNPGAARIEVQKGRTSPHLLFGCGIYANTDRAAKVAAWLGVEQVRAERLRAAGSATPSVLRGKVIRASHAATHVKGRHDDSVSSFVVNFAEPVHWYEFAVAMGRVLQTHGPKILRVKGLMNIAGDSLPRVVHCVQAVAYPPVSLTGWPQQSLFGDRCGRLVFIVCDLSLEAVDAIRCALSGAQHKGASSRQIMAACPVPTRCWLACNVRGRGASTIEVDGWDVQPIRLGKNSG